MHNIKPSSTPNVMGLKLSKEDCSKNVNPTLYKSMVGSLMYLIATRPDIMYVVSVISRFMETPKETHWQVSKMILSYVNGRKKYGVLYSTFDDFIFTGNDVSLIPDFKTVMKSEFEMIDLGLLRYLLGIEVKQTKKGIFIS